MKILLTKSIEKELLKIVLSKKSIKILIDKIKKQNIEGIYLKRPFVKIKISIFGLALRLVGEFRKVNGLLILILIVKKKDKNIGNNLLWGKEIERKITNILLKISQEILDKEFKIY